MPLLGSVVTIVVLTTLVTDFTLNTLADLLNLRNMKTRPPDAFKDIYSEKEYRRSQEYLKATTRLGLISAVFDLALVLAFWFLKGFPILDSWVRALGMGHVPTGLVYMGCLILGQGILGLPFRIYSTFVIEEKFGFNKTTPGLFIKDLVKGILLSLLLGGLLLSGILAFLEYAGPGAWIFCWLASTIFLLAVQYIVPTWIMPLFNKFDPLPEGDLKDAILNYAAGIRFPISNIFVMDGSKRSTKSNAFFTGFGKNRRIVLFDTLIREHTTGEMVAILAHEMGHFKKRHIIKRLIASILHMGLIFYLLSLFISQPALFDAFFMETPSVYAGLIFFGMLFSPVNLILSMVLQALSRRDEYEADNFAATTLADKKKMILALKKLGAHNLTNLTPHPLYVFLNYSHPPLINRIQAIADN